MADLFRELLAAERASLASAARWRWIRDHIGPGWHGGYWTASARGWPVGLARVEPAPGGRYAPLPVAPGGDGRGGVAAVVAPVWDGGVWDGGGLVDLVAWDAADPARWWTRLGNADWIGAAAIFRAADPDLVARGAVLRLFATPRDFLAAGAPPDGAVRLAPLRGLPAGGRRTDDPYATLRDELLGVGRVVAEPAAGGWPERVHAALRARPPRLPLPEVVVRRAATADCTGAEGPR